MVGLYGTRCIESDLASSSLPQDHLAADLLLLPDSWEEGLKQLCGEIEAAYQKKSLVEHPDKEGSSNEAFTRSHTAYGLLMKHWNAHKGVGDLACTA